MLEWVKTFLLPLRVPFLKGADGHIPLATLERMDDHTLMIRYSRYGDIAAFEHLVQRYRNPVFGYLIQTCRDKSLAEDLYQETFIRVIRAAPRYRKRAGFRTWLFTIARNLVIDAYRKKQARGIPVALTPAAKKENPGEHVILESREPDPLRDTENREIRETIASAVESLPEAQREMFLLREDAGLDFSEAARVAGCSVNTAKSRMRYALLKIRDALSRAGIVPEEVDA